MSHVSHKFSRHKIMLSLLYVDGNTDGVMKGKRYFKCPSKHGRFVRITNILSVLPSRVSLWSVYGCFIIIVPNASRVCFIVH